MWKDIFVLSEDGCLGCPLISASVVMTTEADKIPRMTSFFSFLALQYLLQTEKTFK